MKSKEAYKTIGEVSKIFKVQPYVIRFWEENFSQLKPLKRKGGRRLYSEKDLDLIRLIKTLLYEDKYSVNGVKKYLSDKNNIKEKNNEEKTLNQELTSKLNDIKINLIKIKEIYENKR